MPVVGLIGGIGAGKSRVAAALAARGAAVLDADAIGHALLDQPPSREAVVARFGDRVLEADAPDGPRIDRKALGAIVFADPEARKALESILHPRMRRTFEKAIRRVSRRREAPLVVLDAAILLEAGWDDLCDVVLFVDAPEDARRDRVAASRGWSAERWAQREAAQWPLDRKRQRADLVIENDETAERLEARVVSLWGRLTTPPARRPHSNKSRDDDTSRPWPRDARQGSRPRRAAGPHGRKRRP